MSASIAGTTFFSSSSSSSPRRPQTGRSSLQARTASAPSLQTTASSSSSASSSSATSPPLAPSPMTQSSFSNHPYPQMAHHLASSTVVQPLQPLTPISSPSTTSSPPPLYSNQSVVSFASTTSSASSITGVSRASSCRSTNSVQAVPIKKPQRGPVVPRIVTRGLSAIGAYGLGSPTTTMPPPTATLPSQQQTQNQTSPPKIFAPNSPRPLDNDNNDDDDASSPLPAPPMPQFRQSHSYGSACSPVEEGTSANSSNGSDNEGSRIRRGRRVVSSPGNWTIRDRGESSTSTRGRERVESTSSRGGRNSTVSPVRTSISPTGTEGGRLTVANLRLDEGGNNGTRPRETSTTSNVTVTSANGSTTSGTSGGGGVNMMIPNSMGVVGSKRTVEDFEFGEVLGEGSYSTVTLVRTVHPPYRSYALKVLDKEHIKREKKTKYVLIERDTLKQLDGHPGVVRLYWTFQDEWSLYYVLELAPNGELLKWIKEYGSFDLRSARYYAAQILSAVGFMHGKGVIHRDLKPENVLFAEDMRIKITDFGTAKLLKKEELVDGRPSEDPSGRPRTRSFVGTPEYVSPEVLTEGRESSFSSDFWALGCILFQMLAGRPPFQARTEYLMFQKIMNLEYEFPLGFPPEAKDLVEKLLVVDPLKRLGGDPKNGNGIEAIKSHPFFTSHLTNPSGAFPLMTSKPASSSALPESAFDESDSEEDEEQLRPSLPINTNDNLPLPIRDRIEVPNGSPASLPINPDSAPPSIPSQSPAADSPRIPVPEHPLDRPIDFSRIWTISPPQIRTGLSQPIPVHRGEFVLDLGGTRSGAASSIGTGEEAADGWEDGAQASVSDDDQEEDDDHDETCSSPTSASARDLPSGREFGVGKWSNVLLPSEMILLTSPVLQRPSSAAAARSALLRSSKIKFPSKVPSSLNPLNLITSAASVSNASTATGHSSSGGPVPPTIASAPLPAGTKERTLILTDYPRLLCIKETPKKISIKNEVFLGSALRGGVRREGVSAFIAVEELGTEGKGFVVKTSQRNHKYYEPSGQASRWIHELREAHSAGLQTQPRR
ncbi:PDK1 family serine/threonine-protein kinase [Sporobolomyces salmoneus]|uniref:PDK1 family serine/threonine-protein kinase n=1 Tax=Sporobolomyces salmoneus TaxID=183962 RepID=UPI00317389BE